MSHADEGALQALLDGELDPHERARLDAHLAGCPACAGALDELRGAGHQLRFALRRMDAPPRTEAARAAVLRRRGGGMMTTARRALGRAAVLVLAGAGVAAAAVPGSPVRRWVVETFSPAPAAPARDLPAAPAAPPQAAAPAAEAPGAGISVLPANGRVRVVLTSAAPGLRVRTRLTDAPRAEVRASGDAAGARFRYGPGRVEVVGAGAGEVAVDLPRSARTAVVEVDGRVYLSRQGESTRVLGPVHERAGDETLFLVAP